MGKSQHHTPVLHLANFVGNAPAGHVWTFDKLNGSVRSSIPEETGFETHFYSVEKDDGTMDTIIEDLLAAIESKAAPVYRDLLDGRMCRDQAKLDFANFIACMFARTISMRRMFAEVLSRGVQIRNYAYGRSDKAFQSLVKKIEKDRPFSNEESKDALKRALLDPSSHFKIEISREATLRNLKLIDRLTPIFFNMGWSLVYPTNGYFITSDNAVGRATDPRTHGTVYGNGGFLNKTAEVTFPLSPRVMLLMTWAEARAPSFQISRDAVDGWNRMRAANADRFLFAHLNDKRVAKLGETLKAKRPEVAVEGLRPNKFAETVIRRKAMRR